MLHGAGSRAESAVDFNPYASLVTKLQQERRGSQFSSKTGLLQKPETRGGTVEGALEIKSFM